ncbi:MAG: PQQ-dependent sugar dehydrogenase [Dehalococcoidia bacterium]
MNAHTRILTILAVVVFAAVLLPACDGNGTPASNGPTGPRTPDDIGLGGLTALTEPPGDNGLLYVAEQDGRVLSLPRDAWHAADTVPEPVLDLRDRVHTGGREEGLLGLAFHPEFVDNGNLYIHYSMPGRSVIARFTLDSESDSADPASETVVLEVDQPYANHNGGQLAFGPDGYLYIGLGDGGGAGDPSGNGQDLGTLLGSILRIDVDNVPDGGPYVIPPENPFLDDPEARDEIWAYGLRNPWRFSFDRETGDLWVADVGQNRWESVYIVERGGNYGWNITEGAECYPPASDCDTAGLEMPVHTYALREGGNCAITGGYVYRGGNRPELIGAYVFGDYCSGRIWRLDLDEAGSASVEVMQDTDLSITSFGEDAESELYIVTQDGGIHGLTLTEPAAEEETGAGL